MRYFAIILALVLACGTLQGQDKGKQPDYSYAYPQLHRYQRGTVFDLSEKLLNRKYMYRVNDPWLDVSKEFRKINRSLGPARYENYRLDKPLPLKKGKLYLMAIVQSKHLYFQFLKKTTKNFPICVLKLKFYHARVFLQKENLCLLLLF